jgi:hypothetical protein
MSSPKSPSMKKWEGEKEPGRMEVPSREHEPVYHAASQCQAASLSLTRRRLHDQKKACSAKGKKTGGFASQEGLELSGTGSMELPAGFKSRCVVGVLAGPHGKNDAQPQIGERAHRHRVTLAFSPFALVVGFGPRFAQGRLPGEQVEHIAQWLQASGTAMGLLVIATLLYDRSRSSQRLKRSCISIAIPIISQFRQQSGSQAFACSGQALNNVAVLVRQKKSFDILIVRSDLLNKRQKLTDQNQHQTGFRAGGNRISRQLWLVQAS